MPHGTEEDVYGGRYGTVPPKARRYLNAASRAAGKMSRHAPTLREQLAYWRHDLRYCEEMVAAIEQAIAEEPA